MLAVLVAWVGYGQPAASPAVDRCCASGVAEQTDLQDGKGARQGAASAHEGAADVPRLRQLMEALELAGGDPWQCARVHGEQARQALVSCRRYVDGWLAHADPVSGLIPRNLRDSPYWNGRDSAADNYPFMVLSCALTDRSLFDGRMRVMLRAEQRLTTRGDGLVDDYDFATRGFRYPVADRQRMIFDSSEYVKDGLLSLTEWLGPSPWSDRMIGLVDAIWRAASVSTPFGALPSADPEVNGSMMQATSRIFWLTGERRYLDAALRIARFYLMGDHHPTRASSRLRLRDHGCELISGLTEVYLACRFADPKKAEPLQEPLHALLDRILEVGVTEHGLLYDEIDPLAGTVTSAAVSDTFGYTFNAFYTVFLMDGRQEYGQAVRRGLAALEPHALDLDWQRGSADGIADAVEGALNLFNREPMASTARWIDHNMARMLHMQGPDGVIEGWHGDGNVARTAIMWALWKQQGVTAQPWREDLRVGAELCHGELRLLLSAEAPWSGRLHFDTPRHRTIMHLPVDYPRINQMPEWFVVAAGTKYALSVGSAPPVPCTGEALARGRAVSLPAAGELRIVVAESH